MKTLVEWEALFAEEISKRIAADSVQGQTKSQSQDPAHDLAHLGRVVSMAKKLATKERANLGVVVPAAWLHDLVNVPKDDPRRVMASRLSAQEAVAFLRKSEYDLGSIDEIAHAIEAHSFSAGILPRTLEAMIVQDADRLDALGAIGVARCFTVGALMGRPFYDPLDPFAATREPDDHKFTLDHFPIKLLKLVDTFRTAAGREEGDRRTRWMRAFLAQFRDEIGLDQSQRRYGSDESTGQDK